MSEPIPVVWSDRTEDWAKTTFDFYGPDGGPAQALDDIASVLMVSRLDAATMISNYPYPEAVPPRLRLEAARELRL